MGCCHKIGLKYLSRKLMLIDRAHVSSMHFGLCKKICFTFKEFINSKPCMSCMQSPHVESRSIPGEVEDLQRTSSNELVSEEGQQGKGELSKQIDNEHSEQCVTGGRTEKMCSGSEGKGEENNATGNEAAASGGKREDRNETETETGASHCSTGQDGDKEASFNQGNQQVSAFTMGIAFKTFTV